MEPGSRDLGPRDPGNRDLGPPQSLNLEPGTPSLSLKVRPPSPFFNEFIFFFQNSFFFFYLFVFMSFLNKIQKYINCE